jgi:hypothetical protein
MTGYADAAPAYRAAGWSGVLPLPPGAKEPPPAGFTGRDGAVPDDARVERWRQGRPDWNVALRPGRAVVGIDVDEHKRLGTLAALGRLLGSPLPPTWVSTARTDGSGIYWYRVDPPAPGQRWKSAPLPGCEVVQWGHRYGVVWPSRHPGGPAYAWLEYGARVEDGRVPRPSELPELPPGAQAALLEDGPTAAVRGAVAFALTDGEPDERVAARRDEALAACRGGAGSRHDAVRDAVASLARMAERGRPGVAPALEAVGDAFVAAVAADRGGAAQAGAEWRRIAEGALRLVAETELGAAQSGHGIAVLGAADLFAVEQHEPDWLVDPLFERGRLTAVVGAAKSGKSLLVQEVVCALAAGRGVLGQPARLPASTLYLDDENTPVDWAGRLRSFGYGPGDRLPGLHLASFPNLALTNSRDAKRLLALAEELRPDLVVLDTASRFVRGNENDAETWQTLYRECLVRLKALGCAVVRIDHLRQGRRTGRARLLGEERRCRLGLAGPCECRRLLAVAGPHAHPSGIRRGLACAAVPARPHPSFPGGAERSPVGGRGPRCRPGRGARRPRPACGGGAQARRGGSPRCRPPLPELGPGTRPASP